MIVIDITLYVLIGLTIALLIPWACLETAEFFAGMRERSLPHQGGHG
jgi:hypothetical protein